MPEGDIIDVGANLGVFCLPLGQRYPHRQIYAFEPDTRTAKALATNAALNGIPLTVMAEAVADYEGTIMFETRAAARATGSISTREGEMVPCTTLDFFIAKLEIHDIGLLKVDVEGFEPLVFRGASHVLANLRPRMIFFEVCPELSERAGFQPNEAASILLRYGYSLLPPFGYLLSCARRT